MDYLRQTMDSEKLNGMFDLPMALRHRKVDVIILPAAREAPPVIKTGSAFGSLKKYADPSLISQEKGAWERAAADKYANR